ncbi:MAG: hypothetical protein M3174_05360, partial [Actinomycetota bacterium]|nr:hypothetical protein [Actinomycetota bacterium]
MPRKWLLVLLSAMLVLGAACGGGNGDDGGTDAGAQTEESETPETEETEGTEEGGGLTITGVDFAFDAPASAPAGKTEITFANEGKEPHELIMVPLAENAPDVTELIKMSQKEASKFFAGEPTSTEGPISPGETKSLEVELQPGTYGLVCFVESKKEKKPHAFLGMVGQMTV